MNPIEILVLKRPDICERWRQHWNSKPKNPLSLVEFSALALEKERKANREMPEGAAFYADIP